MIATFKDAPGVGRDIRIVRTGFKLNGEAPSVDTPPPLLGEHTEEILATRLRQRRHREAQGRRRRI